LLLPSEYLYVSLQGSVWFMAHVVATTFVLLYLWECLGRCRAPVAGLFLGLAGWARTTTLFLFPLFVVLSFAAERRQRAQFFYRQLAFFLPLLVSIGLMLVYNKLRFDSFLDFGYSNMSVNQALAANLHTYGQFNIHFLGTDLRYMLFEPFFLSRHFPFLSFNPQGTGIFFTMPVLIFAFFAFRERKSRPLAVGLALACLLTMMPLLLYFNTGWVQFGARFSLDFLPLALLLAILGMHAELKYWEYILIAVSIIINVIGAFAF
jgi:hypothetical protein